jgi:gas vesicle protein
MYETNGQNYSTAETHSLFTFMLGAIAGAAIALMFAPARGSETRDLIAQRGRRVKEKSREMLGEHGERLSSVVDRGRETAREFGDRVSQAVEQGKAGYRSAVRQGRDMANDAVESTGDAMNRVRGGAQTNAGDTPSY